MKKWTEIREDGSNGGLVYAMCLIAILMAAMIFNFVQFNSNVYVIKSDLENGLHIVEGSVMTSNQRYEEEGKYLDDYERELSRYHIVTSDDYVGQCEYIGNAFTTALRNQFDLDENGVPLSGTLSSMARPWQNPVDPTSGTIYAEAKLLITNPVVIYEPTYTITQERVETGNPSRPYEFEETYTITGWTKYSLYFNTSTNEYDHVVKEAIPSSTTPRLQNGNVCEGATIEATITVPFYGVNRIFADASTATYNQYYVSVTQSTDVVITSLDSRDAY